MSLIDEYNSKPSKTRKTIRIIGVFLALVLIAVIAHACVGPAQAQPAGRGPEQVHFADVTVRSTDGRRIEATRVAALPPLGYVFVDDNGRRWRIVGGEFTSNGCSATRCVTRATVTVEPETAIKPTG